MSKNRQKKLAEIKKPVKRRRWSEYNGIIIILFSIISFLSLVTFNASDKSFSSINSKAGQVDNLIGVAGAYIADLYFQSLGMVSFLLVATLLAAGVIFFLGKHVLFKSFLLVWLPLLMVDVSILTHLFFKGRQFFTYPSGGVLGELLATYLIAWFSRLGAFLLSSVLLLIIIMALTGFSPRRLSFRALALFSDLCRRFWQYAGRFLQQKKELWKIRKAERAAKGKENFQDGHGIREGKPAENKVEKSGEVESVELNGESITIIPPTEEVVEDEPMTIAVTKVRDEDEIEPPMRLNNFGQMRLPSIDLLESKDDNRVEYDSEELKDKAAFLTSALEDYGIKGKVTNIRPGPVVIRFEFKPDKGTRISKISSLSNDLAMALSAQTVMIEAPIPGKDVVGIDLPNQRRATVYLKEILESAVFTQSESNLTLALGKDIEGKPVVGDLAKMPHLLVGGATGAGKSITVHSLICSILFKSTPEDVRFILVDPKMSEFSMYQDIPHLLLPVVIDSVKAAQALKWAVVEMERRYELLNHFKVRDIKSYNRRLEKLKDKSVDTNDVKIFGRSQEQNRSAQLTAENEQENLVEEEMEKLPSLVIIIDELADLMMTSPKDVEQAISRLSAKARAAGIHLILATQRPSADVITGLIKANMPSRFALKVSNQVNSKIILEQTGAENLLSMGDMLAILPKLSKPLRIHGSYVSEKELKRLQRFLKSQGKPQYQEEILISQEEDEFQKSQEEEMDEKYDLAVHIAAQEREITISRLQRKMSIGYNRAAKYVERMERNGILGPQDRNKPRQVLIPPPP